MKQDVLETTWEKINNCFETMFIQKCSTRHFLFSEAHEWRYIISDKQNGMVEFFKLFLARKQVFLKLYFNENLAFNFLLFL